MCQGISCQQHAISICLPHLLQRWLQRLLLLPTPALLPSVAPPPLQATHR